jgi:hypothetical protein
VATRLRRAWGRDGLGFWICGPLLALVVVFWAVAGLPAVECGEGGGPSTSQESRVAMLTLLASLAVGVAAAWRLAALRRRGAWRSPGQLLPLGAAAVVLAGATAAVADGHVLAFLAGACLAGLAVTAIAFLALVVAWALGRSTDDVGGLLPLYLFGAGLFCYPLLLLFAVVANSGIGC